MSEDMMRVNVNFRSGGSIQIEIRANLLTLDDSDYYFVSQLIELIRRNTTRNQSAQLPKLLVEKEKSEPHKGKAELIASGATDEIVRQYQDGSSYTALAHQYGTWPTTIRSIIKERVPPEEGDAENAETEPEEQQA